MLQKNSSVFLSVPELEPDPTSAVWVLVLHGLASGTHRALYSRPQLRWWRVLALSQAYARDEMTLKAQVPSDSPTCVVRASHSSQSGWQTTEVS